MKQHNILLNVIVFAILTRISIPFMFGHLPNFSALDALALFCGAYCERRIAAIVLCIGSVWIGDILLTHTLFYPGFYWQYASYGLIVMVGSALRQGSKWIPAFAGMTAAAALISAMLFFVLTNFGVWFSGSMYPHTINGLIACYIAAIPFFKCTLVSDVVFTAVLFGVIDWIPRGYKNEVPYLRGGKPK